jgi:sorting nexin-29
LHIPVPTVAEVYGAIREIKNNRAPGEDAITAELIKEGGRCLWRNIYQLTVFVWEKEIMLEEWQTAIIFHTYKKGNVLECEFYRGISLLNVAYMIFTDILTQCNKVYTDEIFGEYQCGFGQGHSTTDHIFATRQILEKQLRRFPIHIVL